MSPSNVNAGSRIGALVRQGFTLLALAGIFSASVAHADRVVVLRATGDAATLDLERIEDQVHEAIRALSHEAVTEGGGMDTEANALPETANEMRAIAEMRQPQWVVVPIVHDPDGDIHELSAEGWRDQTPDGTVNTSGPPTLTAPYFPLMDDANNPLAPSSICDNNIRLPRPGRL